MIDKSDYHIFVLAGKIKFGLENDIESLNVVYKMHGCQ
jgi:hypothetical protein